MTKLEKQLSRFQEIADQTLFHDLQITETLKNRVKEKSTVFESHGRRRHIPRIRAFKWLAAVAVGVLIIAFVSPNVLITKPTTISEPTKASAAALTVKYFNSATLYTTGIMVSENDKVQSLEANVDSFNERYYRWSPDGRYLVYGNQGDLFLYDAKAKETRNLTNTPDRWELMPFWSPNGDSLSFTSRPLEQGEGKPSKPGATPWVMQGSFSGSPTVIRADGTGYTVLEEGKTINPPSWSPDGKKLAYDMNGSIHLYNLDDKKVTVINPNDYGLKAKYLSAPSWSPSRPELTVFFSDSNKSPLREEIMSGSAAKPRQGYALIDLESNAAHILYQYNAPFVSVREPALWSGDGNKIAILFRQESIVQDPIGLMVLDRNGENLQEVGKAYLAKWEPGGERLAYIDSDDSRIIHILSPVNHDWKRETLKYENFLRGFDWQPSIKPK